MNVWILQTGEPLQIDDDDLRPLRAINLSNKLAEAGHNVVVFSSAFYHQKKYQRAKKYTVHKVNENIEIRLIPSIGYSKHIGLRRLLDHFQLAWNLNKILKKETNIPDVAFIGYPPIETASVMSKWLKEKDVPMMLDIQDLWPAVFVDAFPILLKPFAKFLFYIYFYLAKETMKNANGISAMSESFLKWTLAFSGKSRSTADKIVRLTVSDNNCTNEDLDLSNKWWKSIGVKDQTYKVFFIGTFSTSFEFEEVYIAAKKLSECQFILCGDGPLLDKVKVQMNGLSNVIFPGWIDIVKMKSLSDMSIASIAPYKNVKNFTLNIPNKIVDSLVLGLPILSPLGGEVEELVKKYNIGFIYGAELSLSGCIDKLIRNKDLQEKMSTNSRELYSLEFEFNYVYENLVNHLELLAKNQV